MRISDWSSDVCSSDLGFDDRLDEAARRQDRLDGAQSAQPRTAAPPAAGEVVLRPLYAAGRLLHLHEPVHARSAAGALSGVGGEALPHRPPSPLPRRLPELGDQGGRSEEHTSELQSLMRNSYAVFCLKKTTNHNHSITK